MRTMNLPARMKSRMLAKETAHMKVLYGKNSKAIPVALVIALVPKRDQGLQGLMVMPMMET